ncbi:PAS domain S-box protein [Candidatus Woesearchaeota archaeon]|nr:PAS domain S-box protein [Candidatus Woesearchaeota archaeon]
MGSKTIQKAIEEYISSNKIIDELPVGVDIVDQNLNILYMNKHFLKKFGKKAIGKKCYQTYKKNKKQCLDCPLKKPIKIGESKTIEVPGIIGGKVFEITHKGIKLDGQKAILEVFRDITEKKKAEKELKVSEEKFRGLFELNTDGISVTNIKGELINANKALLKMLGYNLEELMKKTYNQITPKKWHKKEADIIKNQIEKRGYSEEYEKEYIKKNGSIFPVSIKVSTMKKNGKPIAWSYIKDITKRKKTEKKLARSEENYRLTFDSLRAGIVVHAANTQILFSNKEASNILGLSREQMAGKKAIDPAWNFVYQDGKKMALKDYPVNIVLSTKKPLLNYVLGINRPDRKNITWVIVNGVPVSPKNKKTEKVIINFIDITEKKKAEKEIKNLAKFPAENPYPVIRVDKNFKVTYQNKAIKKFLKHNGIRTVFNAIPSLKDLIKKSLQTKKTLHDLDIPLNGFFYSFTIVPVSPYDYVNIYALDVTDRKKSEEVLRESEEKFRLLIEQSPVAVQIMNIDGKIIQVNDAYAKLWGVSRKELSIIHKKYNLLKDDQIKKLGLMPKIKKAFAGETVILPPFEYEPKITRSSSLKGRKRWIQSKLYHIHDKGGKIISVVMMHEDITEQKKAEKQLRESEQKLTGEKNSLDSTIESLPGVFYLFDVKGKFIKWNKTWEKVTEYSSKEMEKAHPLDFFRDDKKHIASRIKEVFTKGESDAEAEFVSKSGKKRIYYFTGKLMEIEGKPYLVGMGIDISDRKKAEEEIKKAKEELEQRVVERTADLSKSERKYKELFDISRDALMTIAPPKWGFTSGNPATVKLFGAKDEKKFTSLGPWDVSPKKQPDGQPSAKKAQKMIMKAMKEGSNFFEWTHQKLNGKTFPATVLLTRIGSGKDVKIQATVRDITERKKSESKVKESEERYRSLFEGASDAILVADPITKTFAFANLQASKLLGYSNKELLKLGITKIHPKKDLKYVLDQFQKQVKGEIKLAENLPVLKKNNEVIYCDINAQPIIINNKPYIVGFFRDITERRKNQEELKNKIKELERFTKIVIGRELKMVGLKRKIKRLEEMKR